MGLSFRPALRTIIFCASDGAKTQNRLQEMTLQAAGKRETKTNWRADVRWTRQKAHLP